MNKISIIYISILILFLFNSINAQQYEYDLSDDNPIVYCLKAARHMTLEQIKEYYLKTQLPQYVNEKEIDDPAFNWCVEQASRDDD